MIEEQPVEIPQNNNWHAIGRVGYASGLRDNELGEYLKTTNKVLKEVTERKDKTFDSFDGEYFKFLQKEVFPNREVIRILQNSGVKSKIISYFERGTVPNDIISGEVMSFKESEETDDVVIKVPEEVSAEVDHLRLTVSGPNGSVTRRLWYPNITVTVENEYVVIDSGVEDAETKATVGTFESHVRNMIHGVSKGWEYTMEVYYSHFPMQVRVNGDEIVIENFLGEKAPRRTGIHGDTTVEVDDETIYLRGPNIEDVGQTAADLEQLTRVKDKDTRVFQDGVYITNKPQAESVGTV